MIAHKNQIGSNGANSAAVTPEQAHYAGVLERYTQMVDPIRVVSNAAALVIDYDMRQQNSDPANVPLRKLWLMRREFVEWGLLVPDARENTEADFMRHWRQLRLERDLSHELMDCATLLRTVFNRHSRARGSNPFWFMDAKFGQLDKFFRHDEAVKLTKRDADKVFVSALRSAPPSSLVKSIHYISDEKNWKTHPEDWSRVLFLSLTRELQRRMRRLNQKAGRKPAYRKTETQACPYASEAEFKYARDLAALYGDQPGNGVWIVGSKDYIAQAPVPNARLNASKLKKEPGGQMVLGAAVLTEGSRQESVAGQWGAGAGAVLKRSKTRPGKVKRELQTPRYKHGIPNTRDGSVRAPRKGERGAR